jgi:hypothetical protein
VKYKPKQIDGIQAAFPTSVEDFLPDYGAVPDEFKSRHNKWVKLVSRWFFSGLKGAQFKWKDGIDGDTALRHLKYCMGSWEPKHEHKEAGVAYLMSLWLDDVIIPDEQPVAAK